MSLQIYKPNSKNTGCAASFQISEKTGQEPVFYINCIAQFSWNEREKTGSFAESRKDPSKPIAVKFNEFELGEIVNAIQQKSNYSTYHSNDTNKTTIRVAPFERVKGSGDYAVKYTAFGFAFTRNGSDQFKVPLEPGEAIRLIAFINKYFSLVDEFRLANAKANYNKESGGKQTFQPATTKSAPQKAPAPVLVEDDDSF